MKNKNKSFVFKYVFLMPLFTVAFFMARECLANDHLVINEVQISGGTGKTNNDFIELYNPTDKKVNLKDYKLVKRTKTGTSDDSIKSWMDDAYIFSGGYYLWANSADKFGESLLADCSTTATITKDNAVALIEKDSEKAIDSVGWGAASNIYVETKPASNPPDNKSIERKKFKDTDDNSEDFEILDAPTPTHSSAETSDDEDKKPPIEDLSGKIKINEVYPSPDAKAGESEFVEIKDISDKDITLTNCYIEDALKHKSKTFASLTVKAGELNYFSGNFSLNTDKDSVYLYCDGLDNAIDSLDYIGGETKHAYAYDGTSWQWTSQPTKGEKNKFDEIIAAKIIKNDSIYVNTYAEFDVDTNEKAQKFTWNFGDGHKSYLKETRHLYEETGKFDCSLKISGAGKTNTLFFEVKVEKYKAPKIRIVGFSPNPKGSDTKNEWINIQNKSDKRINLKNWSVATGWENLYNHPIRDDFIVKPGKTKKLTKKICAFTLNNSKTKIELRDFSGNVVQSLKYDRTKDKISEDETYEKTDAGWAWNKPVVSEDNQVDETNQTNKTDMTDTTNETDTIIISPVEEQNAIGKISEDLVWKNKQQNRIIFLGYDTRIKTPIILANSSPRVAGAETEKIIYPTQKHWAIQMLDNLWIKFNSAVNKALNII